MRRATIEKPSVQRLEVDAYALLDHADPDPAAPWIDCSDPDPADGYLVVLYESRRLAEAAIPARARKAANAIFPANPEMAEKAIADIVRETSVRRVRSSSLRGRDYRSCACQTLPHVLPEIQTGDRESDTWNEIVRQREVEHVNAAILPGPTAAGTLFVFVEAAAALEIGPPLE